jgi:FkbH-like protein
MTQEPANPAGDSPANASASPLRDAHNAWRTYTRSNAPPNLEITITASFTADALAPYLGSALLAAGCSPLIHIAPFNQIIQTLSAPPSHAPDSSPHILIVLPRLDELVSDEFARFSAGDSTAWPAAQQKLSQLASALQLARSHARPSDAIIAATLPPPATPESDLLALDRLSSTFYERASSLWRDALSSTPNIHTLDLAALLSDFGLRHAFDPRLWYLYRQPFAENFLFELGHLAARLISATRRASKKCAVIDCDNTLWGGIIGEDGLEGIKLGDEFPGSAYRDFQKLLLHWRRQGIFLAVCSKNNDQDVRQVFRSHQAMLLKENDISAWSINWEPKSQQIAAIAQKLNVGIDSLVFFDDSAYEINQVLSAYPEMRCVQLPAAPEQIVSAATRTAPFDQLEITADDRARAERYAVESHRETLRESLSLDDFIRTLEVHLDITGPTPDNLTRIVQLINKTNQFNLTTLRLTKEQVKKMAASPDHIIRAATVRDKFGEYGLTCVAIAERRGADWHLIEFLLSCRVLGRGVESAFLRDIASQIVSRGGDRLIAQFIPTPKNSVASQFLPLHGFSPLNSPSSLSAPPSFSASAAQISSPASPLPSAKSRPAR